jgi:hypothetical protein
MLVHNPVLSSHRSATRAQVASKERALAAAKESPRADAGGLGNSSIATILSRTFSEYSDDLPPMFFGCAAMRAPPPLAPTLRVGQEANTQEQERPTSNDMNRNQPSSPPKQQLQTQKDSSVVHMRTEYGLFRLSFFFFASAHDLGQASRARRRTVRRASTTTKRWLDCGPTIYAHKDTGGWGAADGSSRYHSGHR